MSESTQNLPIESSSDVSQDAGSEEAAINAFEKREQPQPTPDEADPENEPSDDTDEEPSDGEPEDEPDAKDELVEAEFEGKTYKVAPELQKALLRQSDYSRSMNEVSAQKKTYADRIEVAETYIKGAEKYAEVLADVQTVDARLKQFDSVNWQQLRSENPGEYAAMAADMQTLRLSRDQYVQRAHGIQAEISQAQQQGLNDKRAEMSRALAKDLKGWGDELGTKISKYAMDNGYQASELDAVTDPKWVIAMDKARRFDALQTAKADIKAKAKDAPAFVKPGSPRKADPRSDAMARLKNDNSIESAEAAFLQRYS